MDPRLVTPFYPVQFDTSKPHVALGIPSNNFNGYTMNEVRAVLQMGVHATRADVEDPSDDARYELFKRNIVNISPTSPAFFLEARDLLKQSRERLLTLLGEMSYEALETNGEPYKFFRYLVSIDHAVVEAIPDPYRNLKLDGTVHGEHVRVQELANGEVMLRVKVRSMASLVLTVDKVLTEIAQNL